MAFKCKIGLHSWNGCKCSGCEKTRDEQHDWTKDCEKCSKCGKAREKQHDWSKDCEKCAKCGKTRENPHDWKGCKCSKCSKTRDEQHDWNDCKCSNCGKEKHTWSKDSDFCVCEECCSRKLKISQFRKLAITQGEA